MSVTHHSHFMRWVIVLCFTCTALFAGYGVVSLLLLRQAEQFTTLEQTATATTAAPVVENLPVDSLVSGQWFRQTPNYSVERAEQLSGITNQPTVPLPPTQLAVVDTTLGNRVFVQWSQPLGQRYAGVEVARGTDSAMTTPTIVSDQPLPPSGEWLDVTVQNNTVYYYRLRSYQLGADATPTYSQWSEILSVTPTDTTPPAPPTLVAVSEAMITWQASPSQDVRAYRLYRSIKPGELGNRILQTDDATVTAARDTTSVPGATYYYTVTALDAAGNESSTTLATGTLGNPNPFIDRSSDDSE